jgi:hypothetical protein
VVRLEELLREAWRQSGRELDALGTRAFQVSLPIDDHFVFHARPSGFLADLITEGFVVA